MYVWRCNKLNDMRQLNITFRTDASIEIGTGHVMRCMTLAESLRKEGSNCQFICREHKGNLLSLIRERGFTAFSLPRDPQVNSMPIVEANAGLFHEAWLGTDWETDALQTQNIIGSSMPDWLIVDHYSLDARWESRLNSKCKQLMVIDDLADRPHLCELLLDQNWSEEKDHDRYDHLIPTTCKTLLGPRYALLQPEFIQFRKSMPPRDGVVRRILVFLGGSDPGNQTKKVLEALMYPDLANFIVDVVIGTNHSDPQGIKKLVASRSGTRLYQGLPSLAGLMAQADLMIGAGGATSWERMCLGLPAIVISIAKNQISTNQALKNAGYIHYLGEMDAVSVDDIVGAVQYAASSAAGLRERSIKMQNLVPGDGVVDVVNILQAKVATSDTAITN